MSLSGVIGTVVLALLQGAVVALPRADALDHLGRLRSPGWAAVLPGVIIVGTLGVLAVPSMAYGLVVLAAVATPVLALVAVFAVVRDRRVSLALAPVAAALLATRGTGWIGESAASLLTALGCLFLGAALVRLIPGRLLAAGVLAMCAVDVALMASGLGQSSWVAMSNATSHFHGPVFDQAVIGSVSTDYVDLFLAAVVGVMLSGHVGVQRRAAALVCTIATGYGMLALLFGQRLPATVPIVLALLLTWRGGRTKRSFVALAFGRPGRHVVPLDAAQA